jgi:uncharacterized protein (TIGR03000 family)
LDVLNVLIPQAIGVVMSLQRSLASAAAFVIWTILFSPPTAEGQSSSVPRVGQYGATDTYFGAIAYSMSTGSFCYCYGHLHTRPEAEACALAKCTAADSKIIGWASNQWMALARAPDNSWGAGYDLDRAKAEAAALRNCQQFNPNADIVLCVWVPHEATSRIEIFDIPPSADVFLDGSKMSATGRFRSFTTPAVFRNIDWHYDVSAHVLVNGEDLFETKRIAFRGDKVTSVSFPTLVTRVRNALVPDLEEPLMADAAPELPQIKSPRVE